MTSSTLKRDTTSTACLFPMSNISPSSDGLKQSVRKKKIGLESTSTNRLVQPVLPIATIRSTRCTDTLTRTQVLLPRKRTISMEIIAKSKTTLSRKSCIHF